MTLFKKNLKKAIYFIMPFIIYEVLRECVYMFAQTVNAAWPDVLKLLLAGVVTLPVMLWMYIREKPVKKHFWKTIISSWKIHVFGCLLGCLLGLFFSFLATLLAAGQLSEGYSQASQSLFSGEIWMQIFGVGIIIPIAEEMTFRGLVYTRAKLVFSNVAVATIFSSVLFGAFHGNLIQMFAGVISGGVMCLLYERSDTITAPALCHIGFNLSGIILKNAGFYIASGRLLGVVTMILGIVCAGGVLLLMMRKPADC